MSKRERAMTDYKEIARDFDRLEDLIDEYKNEKKVSKKIHLKDSIALAKDLLDMRIASINNYSVELYSQYVDEIATERKKKKKHK